jgi:predicted short-subunit dehydrogenase-like oxidoreductase (DUF2520 family)
MKKVQFDEMNSLANINSMVIIGSGNVATHLARAFSYAHINILQVYSRNIEHARELANVLHCNYTSSIAQLLENADMYFFALSDSAIPQVLEQGRWKGKVCVHTAGSVPMEIFRPYTDKYGVIYPLQTFSKTFSLEISKVPFFIEACDEDLKKKLTQLTEKISQNIFEATSEQRFLIHLAAVFANNFSNYMFVVAQKILETQNIPFDVLKPIIEETVRKAIAIGPENAQTGPAMRNNLEILKKHAEFLKGNPEWQKIYTFVSESIRKNYLK